MKDLKFEEALAKLEEIVRDLKQELPLEDSSSCLSRRGPGQACSKKLDEAEGKIQILLSEDGEPTREEFAVEEDAL